MSTRTMRQQCLHYYWLYWIRLFLVLCQFFPLHSKLFSTIYIFPFHIFLPNQVYLIFKKVVMYKQHLKQVYKDGTIFQLFQSWEKYGVNSGKSQGVKLYPIFSTFPNRSILVERKAHLRGQEWVDCCRYLLTSSNKSQVKRHLGSWLSKLEYGNIFTDQYYPSRCFHWTGTLGW